MGHLTQVVGVAAEQRLDMFGEVAHLPGLAHLGGEEDPDARLACDLDGPVGSLVLGHPAEEQDVGPVVVTGAVAHGEVWPRRRRDG